MNELHEPVRHAARDEAVVGGDAEVEDRRGKLDGVHLEEGEQEYILHTANYVGQKKDTSGRHMYRDRLKNGP